MTSETWLRVLLAVVVPILWGLGSAWIFDRFRLRRACKTDDANRPKDAQP